MTNISIKNILEDYNNFSSKLFITLYPPPPPHIRAHYTRNEQRRNQAKYALIENIIRKLE